MHTHTSFKRQSSIAKVQAQQDALTALKLIDSEVCELQERLEALLKEKSEWIREANTSVARLSGQGELPPPPPALARAIERSLTGNLPDLLHTNGMPPAGRSAPVPLNRGDEESGNIDMFFSSPASGAVPVRNPLQSNPLTAQPHLHHPRTSNAQAPRSSNLSRTSYATDSPRQTGTGTALTSAVSSGSAQASIDTAVSTRQVTVFTPNPSPGHAAHGQSHRHKSSKFRSRTLVLYAPGEQSPPEDPKPLKGKWNVSMKRIPLNGAAVSPLTLPGAETVSLDGRRSRSFTRQTLARVVPVSGPGAFSGNDVPFMAPVPSRALNLIQKKQKSVRIVTASELDQSSAVTSGENRKWGTLPQHVIYTLIIHCTRF